MYKKSITMSYEQAVKIASDMLDVFQSMFEQRQHPLKFNSCEYDESPNIIYKYKVVRNNRHFEVSFWDFPDNLGFCSILPEFDPFTYVTCDIVEKRSNGDKKYEMTFGFNIEKGTFLELFELVHYNTVGILRE